MPCPNKNLQSWKDLVSALGSDALAMAAYTMNNWDIPSIALAKQLIEKSKEEKNKDEGILEVLKKNRIQRVDAQIKTLDKIIDNTNIADDQKIKTLSKLRENMVSGNSFLAVKNKRELQLLHDKMKKIGRFQTLCWNRV